MSFNLSPLFSAIASVFRLQRPSPSFSGFAMLSRWQADSPYRRIHGVIVKRAEVPCADCRVCCTQGNVVLDTRVDRLFDYMTDAGADPHGNTVYRLRHHEDGSCIYLKPLSSLPEPQQAQVAAAMEAHNPRSTSPSATGEEVRVCSIYEHRPSMCRSFDCREFAHMSEPQVVRLFERREDAVRLVEAARGAVGRSAKNSGAGADIGEH